MSARAFTAADFEPIVGRAVSLAIPNGAIGPNGSAIVASVDDHAVTLRIGKSGHQQRFRLSAILGLTVFPPSGQAVGAR
jgi:hypothetical protein